MQDAARKLLETVLPPISAKDRDAAIQEARANVAFSAMLGDVRRLVRKIRLASKFSDATGVKQVRRVAQEILDATEGVK